MAYKITTQDVDHIISLIEQIADTLTKSDFLTPEEQKELEQYQQFEKLTQEIEDMKRHWFGDLAGHRDYLIAHNQKKLAELEIPYNAGHSHALSGRLEKERAKYVKSNLPSLQKELDLFLAPRRAEIALLSRIESRKLMRTIEYYFIKSDAYTSTPGIIVSEKEKVVHELEIVTAKLEYAQRQGAEQKGGGKAEKPAGTGQGTKKRGKGVLKEQVKNLLKSSPNIKAKAAADLLNKNYTGIHKDTSADSVGEVLKKIRNKEKKHKKK